MAAEAVVGATIQVLLENLLTLSTEQIGLVRNFKDDLKKLQKTISLLKAFLHDAEEKQVTAHAVKIWLRELEALAFEADNVFDDVNYRLLSKKVEATRIKKVMRKVQSFYPCSYRLKLGRRIKDINEKLEFIHQQARDLGLQEKIAAEPPSHASASRQTDSFSEDPIFLGRAEEVSSVVGTLITTEPKLSVLPIVGMGGLGKTTLVRKVFNHEQTKSHFGDKQRVWVHVPRIFDEVVLLERTLTSVETGSGIPYGNREALLKKLQEHLGAKKYLLVLDDVWNEDRERWDGFVNSLSGISSATGNCIIVTTRSETVGSIVGTLPIHKLKGLSKDDCWSIIKARAFREGDDPFEFEALEAAGKIVAKKCQGSPLAANLVGGLLVGKSKDEWMSTGKNWLSDLGDENPITKILKLSFDNLSSPSLKKCFAYCSIFPKGYLIEKERLAELWMAEGFLQTLDGHRVFALLLQSSLLQIARRDHYGNVTHCNMHDHVHDLAVSILGENDNVIDGVCQRRYIGHKSSGDGFLSIPEGQERYVRTLFFEGKVSDIRFSNFKSLRTLTLVSEKDIDYLPISIRKLKHLRYLDMRGTNIRYLPDSIGELYHLQTLRGAFSYLEKLPDSLNCLISLMHFHIHDSPTLPPKIGKLTSLQTLPYFHVGDEKGRGISELGNLKNLKGKLAIHNLEKVRDKNEARSADLSQKSDIYELVLVWDESREGDKANDESVMECLKPHHNLKRLEIIGFKGERLSPWEGLNNLVKIKLEKCGECEELPMLGNLKHLKSLYLIGLTNVKSIRSSFYGNIDICRKDTLVVVFRALEWLELKNMSNLKEWDEVDLPLPSQVFPRLKYLKINECEQLTRAPNHFPCLKKLEINGMESSLTLENICGIKLTSLTCLIIRKIEKLECLPDWLFSNNHKLTKLYINDCPKMTHLVPHFGGGGAPSHLRELMIWNCWSLRDLPDDLHSLNSLERLVIEGCPDLKSIPYQISGGRGTIVVVFPALERLELKDMPSLKEWDEVDLPSPSQVFPRLKYLKINVCEQLMRAPSHFPCLEELEITYMASSLALENICGIKLTSLTRLTIGHIEGLECLPDWLFSNNHNLMELMIRNCPKMTHLVPHFGGGRAPSLLRELRISNCRSLRELPDDLHRLNSLERLEIKGCPDLKSIPYYPISSGGGGGGQQQQGLTSLRWLRIEDCSGLTNLPIEMVESCAKSLEELILSKLRSIRNLGMVIGCLQRMTRLRELEIMGVPKFSSSKDIIGGSLISLQELTMGPSSSDSSWNNVSFNEAFVAIMLPQSIGSLRTLHLHGKEDWDSLPDQLQHLTSLEELYLYDFGIEALPEWFGNLSSLETLSLECCEKLRHLPSKQAMQRLSKLTDLEICDSPLLLKWYNPRIVCSEWPKIYHIPRVRVL